MDNARIASATSIALEGTAGEAVDFGSAVAEYLADGETIDYITYADPVDLTANAFDAHLSTLTSTSIALANAGTYTVCIRTNAYNFFIVTVTVSAAAQ